MTTRIVDVLLRAQVAAYLRNTKLSEKATKDLKDEIERLNSAAHAFTKAGLIASLAAVPGAAAPAGAAIAILPGLALGAAASFGTLAIATDGMGDAFKAVSEGDADKLREALASLSGEQRKFVAEYQRVRPIFTQMATRTQDKFWIEMRGDLDALTQVYMPTLLDQIPKLSGELGKAGHGLAEWAGSPAIVARINGQIALATDVTNDYARTIKAATGMMLDLADASSNHNRNFVKGMAEGTEAMERWVNRAKATGQLNAMLDNGQRVMSKLVDLGAKLGEILFDIMANPALTDAALTFLDVVGLLLDMVHKMLSAFSSLPGPVQSALAGLIAFGGATLLVAGRVAAMRAAVMSASLRLREHGDDGVRAANGLEKTALWAGRAAAAFAALQVASMLLATFQAPLAPQFDAFSAGLVKWTRDGKLAGEAARVLGKDLADLDVGLKYLANTDNSRMMWVRNLQDSLETLIPGLAGTNTSLAKTRERVEAVDQVLSQLVHAGKTSQAALVFRELAKSQEKHGVSTKELMAMFPQYAAAIEVAGKSTLGMGAAQEKAALNAAILNEGLRGAVREAGSLSAAFDLLHGKALTLADAEIQVEDALDNLIAAFKENGKSMDVTNEKGRETKKAWIDMIEASVGMAQAKYDETVATKGETAALQEANAVYYNYIGQLRNAMLAAGMNKVEVEKLLLAYTSMPSLISTTVTTPGLDTAIEKTMRLLQLRAQLGSNAAAANAYSGSGYVSGRRWGGITEHARDGLLREAQIYSSVASGARYAFAEPSTFGEAFVPRNGIPDRSLRILNHAAGWYGHTLAPTPAGRQAAPQSSGMSTAAFASAVRSALHGVSVVIDGRAVGQIQARQADLLVRGG